MKIEKINETNFHAWKQKIQLVLAHQEVEKLIEDSPTPPADDSDELQAWLRKDKTARMIIGLSLSDDMLENVRHTSTEKHMCDEILQVFESHTLLNKLNARRNFYTATMLNQEKMLSYINRVRQLAAVLKTMGVDVDDKEIAMAVLNGLPEKYETLVTALDAIGDADVTFTLDIVKSRLLQEEQRANIRTMSHPVKGEPSALFNRTINKQTHQLASVCTVKGQTIPSRSVEQSMVTQLQMVAFGNQRIQLHRTKNLPPGEWMPLYLLEMSRVRTNKTAPSQSACYPRIKKHLKRFQTLLKRQQISSGTLIRGPPLT